MPLSRFTPRDTDLHRLGLHHVDMKRLGNVVVLAGPNGAGKTRILELVNSLTPHAWTHQNNPARSPNTQLDNIQFSAQSSAPVIARFTSKHRTLGDPMGLAPVNLEKAHSTCVNSLGTVHFDVRTVEYINRIAALHWNASHPETFTDDSEREKHAETWKSLKRAIESVIPGATLKRNNEGSVCIFGKPIHKAGLSDGQSALLVIAAALHAQSSRLDNAIILIDEPESHLHPSALLEYVDRLRAATPNGQIWIATHSVHILAHVDLSSIWFVDDGTVTWGGRTPERVLGGLVGDDEQRGRLERFLQLPSLHGMESFIAECLLPPAVLSTGSDDPQSVQIAEIIQTLRRPLQVLDIGAGKGRILAALCTRTDNISADIDYRALEPGGDRDECVSTIADTYNVGVADARKRVCESPNDMFTKINNGTVDVAVLCNVLHEVPPREWRALFAETLQKVLNPAGFVLIVEDMQIPKGEHAHEQGFILLDLAALQELFDIDRGSEDEMKSFGNDRLKAHLIAANKVGCVTRESIARALRRRVETCRAAIKDARKSSPGGTPSFKAGRLLALNTILFANASLALEEME